MSNGLPEETFNFLIQANGWSRQSRSVDKKNPGQITVYRFKLSKEAKLLRILLLGESLSTGSNCPKR